MPQTVERRDVFETIITLVRTIFGVDVAAISLIEDRQQRFRAIQGLALTTIPLESSFCRATWREGRAVVISDTAADAEFHDHPLVTAQPSLRAYAGVPLKNSEGVPIGTICAIHGQPRVFSERDLTILGDLAQLAASELELREDATLDGLTSYLLRRVFLERAAALSKAASQPGHKTSVVVFDVDHFKAINDRHGHGAGDVVLQSIAGACRAGLRERDLLGRLGGEEFGIVLEGNRESARLVAERLRCAIAALRFTSAAQPFAVTASFGVAEVVREHETVPDALARADAALYEAKAEGRNRTVLAVGPDRAGAGPRVLESAEGRNAAP